MHQLTADGGRAWAVVGVWEEGKQGSDGDGKWRWLHETQSVLCVVAAD